MRAKGEGRTAIEAARRAQIVRAAIETVAELGYARTSFAKIAKRAELSSTGLISYHFAGKEDLVRACAAEIARVATEFIQPRVEAASGYTGKLRAYIESNVDLLVEYPAQLRALVEILGNGKDTEGRLVVDAGVATGRVELFAGHLRDGQRAGEFGAFDVRVIALSLVGAIDALVGSGREYGLDLTRSGRELADAFERVTAPRSPGERVT